MSLETRKRRMKKGGWRMAMRRRRRKGRWLLLPPARETEILF